MSSPATRLDHAARRRRWLVLRNAAESERTADSLARPVGQHADETPVEFSIPTIHLPTPSAAPTEVPLTESATALRELLHRPTGLTWMLLGDSLEPVAAAGRDWRSFAGRLTETIRHTLGRTRDVVIEHLCPGQTLAEATQSAAAAMARFRPDLVLLSLGPQESEAGRRGLIAFERNLTGLIRTLLDAHALPVLCTAPRTPTTEAEATVDQLIYAEALRAIAAEYDLPLVDHFSHWEAAAISARGNAAWFDSADLLPGRFGHQQLAQRIAADLQLVPPVA